MTDITPDDHEPGWKSTALTYGLGLFAAMFVLPALMTECQTGGNKKMHPSSSVLKITSPTPDFRNAGRTMTDMPQYRPVHIIAPVLQAK